MPDMTERLPFPLSQRISSAASAIFNRQGREVDIALGGIPFRLATTPDIPYSIETVPIRKDQVDTETDPGEQSLSGWWRRSQQSWHEGAGYLYQEDSSSLKPGNGFFDSQGVDVFTQGQITLLKKMFQNTNAVASFSRLKSASGSVAFSAVKGGDLYTLTSQTATPVLLHNPAPVIVDGMVTGLFFYDVASDGTLYSGTVASPGTATTWPCGTTPTRLRWGKHRLWIIGGRKLWQPDLSLAGGTPQNPIFTHPNTGWNYTCLAEGLGAMYFGGHDGNSSAIQAVTLTAGTGALPTLSGAAITAAFPDGELVQEIEVLAGTIMGIGTNRGFRVAKLESDGSLTYGPLLIEPAGVTACTSLTTQGRFFLVGFTDSLGVARAYRVDTGTVLDDNVYPYAADIEVPINADITSIATIDNSRLIVTLSDGNVWYQSALDYVASGYLQTGRIRYRTTEPKMYRFLQVEIQPLAGTMTGELILEGGSTAPVITITKQGEVSPEKVPINLDPMRFASVKFTLFATGAGTGTPILNSYQLDAFPAVGPQRIINVPLLCYDKEKSRSGQWYGGASFALDRLVALQTLEKLAQVVTFQDFTLGDTGQIVTIERIRFVQSSPGPTRADNAGGAGGILLLELRTAEE